VSAEENTRLVQTAYEAFGRGDMAAFAELIADDIEWVDPGDPDDDPNAGTFKGKEASPTLVWWSCSDSRLHDVRAPRVHRPERHGGIPGVLRGNGSEAPAARLSTRRHTCGRSGMENLPDSRAITTPQRRRLPTGWSSPARRTGGSYVG
jgi:hypothetical protein